MFSGFEVEGQNPVFEEIEHLLNFGDEILLALAVGQSEYAETELGVADRCLSGESRRLGCPATR